ncbi:MAG: NAD(P)/FAD-dependent oxidoreductase [Proteobacteria bacterium]|nr:NAD(P)/FAD-dependent oxidoreductase [Pseudomonadota bacterium]
MKKIAIIGGGPAGLSSAIHLIKFDKNFLIHLFEKCRIGENIVCAEGFFDFFGNIHVELPEKMKVKKIIISSGKKTEINLPKNSNIFTFSRKRWQKDLGDYARSLGVKIFENTKIEKGEIKKLSSQYDYVLDCSGFSGVSHFVFPEKEVSKYRKSLVPAVQFRLKGDFSSFYEALYANVFDNPPGYFWIFPICEGKKPVYANAGLGILLKDKSKRNLKELLKEMLKEEISHYEIINYSASPIPTRRLKTFKVNNIILLGDSLGLCSPLHGGGIDSAYLSGYYVSKSIIANDFSIYRNFLKELDKRFFKERLFLKLWNFFGSRWVLERLRNKGLFSENVPHEPFSGRWLSNAIIRLFF